MSQSEKVELDYDSVGRTFVKINGMLHLVRQIHPEELCVELTGRLFEKPGVSDFKSCVIGTTPEEIRKNLTTGSWVYDGTLMIHVYLKSGKDHLFDFMHAASAVNFVKHKEIAEFFDSEILKNYASLNKAA